MSKFEEAVRLKQELVDYDAFVQATMRRMQWELPERHAPDGTPITNTRKDLEVFNQILSVIDKMLPQIIERVSEQQRATVKAAVQEAWSEMSDLFKDFTIDLRAEVEQLKAKAAHGPVPGEMR